MKIVKWFTIAFAILCLFIVIALAGVYLLFDPNEYKEPIVSLVKEHTNRDLRIEGDIDLSLLPWLGINLGKVVMSNPQGFTDQEFVVVEQVNLRVALLRLLMLKIEMGKLQLDGLTLNLEKRADGVTNWDDLIAADASAESATTEKAGEEDAGSGSMEALLNDLYIGGVRVKNANITWRDATSNSVTKIENFNLNTNRIRLNKPVKWDINFAFRNQSPKLIAGLKLNGIVNADLKSQRFKLSDIKFETTASGPPVPGNQQTIELSVDTLLLALQEQTATLEKLALSAAGLTLNVDMQAADISGDAPIFKGALVAEAKSLRGVMKNLAMETPETANNKVLGKMNLNAEFQGGLDSVAIESLQLKFDDSTMTGSVSARNFAQPILRVALALDEINADAYLPPVVEVPEGQEETASADSDPLIELPMDDLRHLDLEGTFKIGRLLLMNLNTTEVQVGIKAKNGQIDLQPLAVNLYDGQAKGQVGIDIKDKQPRYATQLSLSNVEIGPLMQDFNESRFLDGKLNANADITTGGERLSALKQGLNGDFSFEFIDGALSLNVRESLRDAKNKLKDKVGKETKPSAPLKAPTKFSSITANAKLDNGTVRNNDLQVKARQLQVTGEGSYALPNDYIDYVLTVLLSSDGVGQDDSLNEFHGFPINVHLKGTLAELDYAKLASKAITGAAGAKVKALADEATQQLRATKEAAEQQAKAELEKRKLKAKAASDKKAAELKATAEKRKAEEKARLKRETEAKKAAEKAKLEEKKQELIKGLFD